MFSEYYGDLYCMSEVFQLAGLGTIFFIENFQLNSMYHWSLVAADRGGATAGEWATECATAESDTLPTQSEWMFGHDL